MIEILCVASRLRSHYRVFDYLGKYITQGDHPMRFCEFALQPRPVLKISQQQQARQAEIQANTPPTPFSTNQQPTPAPASVKVYPQQWQHKWVQKHLAAQMARDAQTVQPTEVDIVKAQMRYADAQRKADKDYETTHGIADDELGWQDEHRWVKRN